MDYGLKDQVALIAGGSDGIGLSTAKVLAGEGAKVSICGRTYKKLESARAEIKEETGTEVLIVQADFSNSEEINRFVAESANHFKKIDILVNSVGSSMFGSFMQVPDEVWMRDISLKLIGAVRSSRAVLPYMQKQGGGRIVQVAGNSGKQPYNWHFPGGAANAALNNFTHSLAQEVVKDNILVTSVCPGPVETPRLRKQLKALSKIWDVPLEKGEEKFYNSLPLKRAATADEVAYLIAFLCSKKANYITGTVITIDGGITSCV